MAVGATAFAIGCCAAVPIAVAALSGVALGAVLGAAGGLLAVAALLVLLPLIRKRRRCEVPGVHEHER